MRALVLQVIITIIAGFIIRIFSIIREGALKFVMDSQLIGLVRLCKRVALASYLALGSVG